MENFWEQFDERETNITATVIADSISDVSGVRATTLLLSMPRIVLAQFNKHRAFSNNVASNRAKEYSTVSLSVLNKPYIPHVWVSKHKGMQGKETLHGLNRIAANAIWKTAIYGNIGLGYLLDKVGASKQYSNRMIETYMYVDVLVTSTEWNNFFIQRNDFHAQVEFQVVARRMLEALNNSTPELKQYGDWHLPFIRKNEVDSSLSTEDQIFVSAARCAKTSYGKPHYVITKEKERALGLINLKHKTPFEHQLHAVLYTNQSCYNIQGWNQARYYMQLMYDTYGEYNDKYLKGIV